MKARANTNPSPFVRLTATTAGGNGVLRANDVHPSVESLFNVPPGASWRYHQERANGPLSPTLSPSEGERENVWSGGTVKMRPMRKKATNWDCLFPRNPLGQRNAARGC